MKSETFARPIECPKDKSSIGSLSGIVASFSTTIMAALFTCLVAPTSHAAPPAMEVVEIIDATQLATEFNQDQPSANTRYRGKKIQIEGTVCKIKRDFAASSQAIACVYLKTGPTLPLVKVEVVNLAKITDGSLKPRNEMLGSVAIVEKKKLSVKLSEDALQIKIDSSTTNTPPSGRSFVRTIPGEWKEVAKVGDTVTVAGICKGKLVDIDITDGSL